jgi:hypothetical protein
MRNSLTSLLAILVLAAFTCQPPAGEPFPTEPRAAGEPEGMLTTDRNSYRAGQTATLRLHNLLDHDIGYNLCFSTLEQNVNGAWVDSPIQDDRICTAELRILPPGETATFDGATIPSDLPPGEYRFRTQIENMNDGSTMQVRSNSFTVR